eukprot:CAMPEP_0174322918 /NCGR_PEP_ID=MMETSP0810-20121108/11389_1 /TAXON_ID=73025 ORGANISM="Eutreptiella gymnastica-like, Strain CCMP1594" /NCGR_SAMPLE_ID=MMETSP0810 /ASSEMBLY_ACC=CAM_ASM_000659 /LENGTH=77 /DNA_ID=CAMNT_0015435029 /DNA_START=140 /DNA_END=373 /DNA_ORIENTATION=+
MPHMDRTNDGFIRQAEYRRECPVQRALTRREFPTGNLVPHVCRRIIVGQEIHNSFACVDGGQPVAKKAEPGKGIGGG